MQPETPAALPRLPAYLPVRTIALALYLWAIAGIGRTLVWYSNEPEHQANFAWMLGSELLFLALFSLFLWRPARSLLWSHVYFAFQSVFVLGMFILQPTMDFLTGQFLLLTYQAALRFSGRLRWAWVGGLILLCGGTSLLVPTVLRNLALQFTTIAGQMVFAAYVAALQEEEEIRSQNQALLEELQATNQQLQAYAAQVEELAVLDERSRLARELHDSVSQVMFSILLNVRAARLLVQRDPERLHGQLETLQSLAQSALSEMRSFIAQLRPKAE